VNFDRKGDDPRQAAADAEAAALKARRDVHDKRVDDVRDVPVSVRRYAFAGDSRTRPELLAHWMQMAAAARTVAELAHVGVLISSAAERTGCFRRVAFEVKPTPGVQSSGEARRATLTAARSERSFRLCAGRRDVAVARSTDHCDG
jgi:hypothetical protein